MPVRAFPKSRLAALAFGLMAATPALAHHPMGGVTPATFAEGLLSGLGHPVIGFDHLAALIGLGLLSARFARGLALPAIWIAAMAAGVGIHLASFDLPAPEVLVSLTVIAIGLAAALRPTLPTAIASLLFAVGGLAHGFALGEAIIGAESAPLVAYLIGLVAIQTALMTGVAFAARRFSVDMLSAPSVRLRLAGLAVAMAGGVSLTLALPTLA